MKILATSPISLSKINLGEESFWIGVDHLNGKSFKANDTVSEILTTFSSPLDVSEGISQISRETGIGYEAVTDIVLMLEKSQLLVPASSPRIETDEMNLRAYLAANGWTYSADYILATYNYKFIHGERENAAEAHTRMLEYARIAPDNERSLKYPNHKSVLDLKSYILPSQNNSLGDPLLTTIASSICSTGSMPVPWSPHDAFLRASPSGGSRHPTEGYLFNISWPNLEKGLYHIRMHEPSLTLIKKIEDGVQNLFPEMHERCQFHPDVIIALTSVFKRNMWRYREPRTYRSVHIDVGHIVENVESLARSFGLRTLTQYAADRNSWSSIIGNDDLLEGFQCSIAIGRFNKIATKETSKENIHITNSIRTPNPCSAHISIDKPYNPVIIRDESISKSLKLDSHRAVEHLRYMRNSQFLSSNAPMALSVDDWLEYNWTLALPSYLASLRCEYTDSGSQGVNAAEKTLLDYTTSATVPEYITGDGPKISLHKVDLELNANTIIRVLRNRRTTRRFRDSELTLYTLSSVLWNGMRKARETRQISQTLGPAGLRFSYGVCIDLYVTCYTLKNQGEFNSLYDPSLHQLTVTHTREARNQYAEALFGQKAPLSACFSITLIANLRRYSWIYRHDRAFRNLLIDAGRLAQSLIVAGEHLGIGCLMTPAIHDVAMNKLLHLNSKTQYPIYSLTFGHKY